MSVDLLIKVTHVGLAPGVSEKQMKGAERSGFLPDSFCCLHDALPLWHKGEKNEKSGESCQSAGWEGI